LLPPLEKTSQLRSDAPEQVDMTSPVPSVGSRDLAWNAPEEEAKLHDRVVQQFAREPDLGRLHDMTLSGALLFGDAKDVSDVCRRARPGTVEDVVCDDVKMQRTQTFFENVAAWAADKAAAFFIGSKAK